MEYGKDNDVKYLRADEQRQCVEKEIISYKKNIG